MPIYEFRCTNCGHEWEETQGANDPDPSRCPRCCNLHEMAFPKEGETIVRLISKSSFVLKGPRWAKDRYGS